MHINNTLACVGISCHSLHWMTFCFMMLKIKNISLYMLLVLWNYLQKKRKLYSFLPHQTFRSKLKYSLFSFRTKKGKIFVIISFYVITLLKVRLVFAVCWFDSIFIVAIVVRLVFFRCLFVLCRKIYGNINQIIFFRFWLIKIVIESFLRRGFIPGSILE